VSELSGLRILITGVVQGVGFRPFVYSLATRLELKGWVRNTSAGVEIEVDGSPKALKNFIDSLKKEAPPLARINQIVCEQRSANGFTTFEIFHSEPIPDAFQPIAPDVGICPDCLRELFDPNDRRYRYPFINCTNCGPRFTIIEDIPYDRPKTTMAAFDMCPECAEEYQNPLDRRFHAQPIACPVCGPHVWLEVSDQSSTLNGLTGNNAFHGAQELLAQGKIIAVKGLGGFHLACDATNLDAVNRLRKRKLRVDKPFAIMMPDIATISAQCMVNDTERQLLESHERPIIILRRKPESTIVGEVAPGQDTLGVMLPYTPLHYLLLTANGKSKTENTETAIRPIILVMTSGNLSEEPIATDNREARDRLAGMTDAFLMHNRPIHTRCDDSVMRIFDRTLVMPIRRARGYAPFPVLLPWQFPPLLAVGAELKNTFCITRDRYAFLSHHIGDLENFETLRSFEDGIAHFERLFRVKPQAIAHDFHPNYLATRYAIERAEIEKIPIVEVQHHHAHIAACMVENGHTGEHPVIGVSFDGTGYGDDGAIWGGEFLLANFEGYNRLAHLDYIPLPGGDKAVQEPWRLALAWLDRAGIRWDDDLPPVRAALTRQKSGTVVLDILYNQIRSGFNTPPTSSMGRLFDAIAALAGVREQVNYEAQAAIEMEALVDPGEKEFYPFNISISAESIRIDPIPVIQAVVQDHRTCTPVGIIAARFHAGVAEMVLRVVVAIRKMSRVSEVALCGGVWQNIVLLRMTLNLLRSNDFTVFVHQQVPCNDGGLALGQVVIAGKSLVGGNHVSGHSR